MGILQVLKDFASGTSIHGLTFIVQPQLSILKRISRAFIFTAAMVYATERLKIAIIGKDDSTSYKCTHKSQLPKKYFL